MAIDIKVRGAKRLRKKLRRAAGVAANMKPANLKAAILIEQWTLRNMQAEGAKQPGALRWPGLDESTKRQRAKKGKWPGRILQVSGRLKNAFQTSATQKEGRVVNRVKYAPFHEEGTKKMPMRKMFPTQKKGNAIARPAFERHAKEIVKS